MVFSWNTAVLYCSCFKSVISFCTHRTVPWHIIHSIYHTKWYQKQLLVIIIRLLLYVLHLFPLTLPTHINSMYNDFIKLTTFVIHRVHRPHFITMIIIHIYMHAVGSSVGRAVGKSVAINTGVNVISTLGRGVCSTVG